jgi:hypothetical protein
MAKDQRITASESKSLSKGLKMSSAVPRICGIEQATINLQGVYETSSSLSPIEQSFSSCVISIDVETTLSGLGP